MLKCLRMLNKIPASTYKANISTQDTSGEIPGVAEVHDPGV